MQPLDTELPMLRTTVLFLTPLLLSTALPPDPVTPRAIRETDVDAYLAPVRALQVFSGVVLVARGDSVLFEKAYGSADLEHGLPLTTRNVFRIASLTKDFTRALAGRLADRGLLQIDSPIRRWLPTFPGADRITLRMLLDHRAGVPNVNSLPYVEDALAPQNLAELVDSLAQRPLDFPPGTSRSYSNGGYAVLARILELATGRPFGPLLHDEILRPLGLDQTRNESDDEIVVGRADGYAPSPLVFGQMTRAAFQSMATKAGGGSLVSTARDLLRWANSVGHAAALEPATWRDLFPQADSWARTGRCPGYNSALLREGRVVVVVLANNYAAGMTYDVARALLALADGQRPKPLRVRAPAEADPVTVASVPGVYRLPSGLLPPEMGTRLSVRRHGKALVAYIGDTPVDVLVPQGGRSFLLRLLWSAATFDQPVDGRSPAVLIQPLYREGSYRANRFDEQAAPTGGLMEHPVEPLPAGGTGRHRSRGQFIRS